MNHSVQPISLQQSHFRIVRISVYGATIGPKFDYEGVEVEQSIAVNRANISIHLLLGPLKWIASYKSLGPTYFLAAKPLSNRTNQRL